MVDSSRPGEPPNLEAFFALGVSLFAATRDDRGVVELTRCACARVQPDGRVWVGIPLPEGERALANIERSKLIALNGALPTNYKTLQVKGHDAVRIEWPGLAEVVHEHRARFVAALE